MEKIKFSRTVSSSPDPVTPPENTGKIKEGTIKKIVHWIARIANYLMGIPAGHFSCDFLSREWIAGYPLRLLGGLITGFLAFFIFADWTAFTTSQFRPGEVVVNNNMAQLWIASYRLIFTVSISIAVIGLAFPFLIRYLRPDQDPDFDFSTSFKKDFSPTQKIWFVFALFSVLCFLFVWLLTVKLPGSMSVGP